MLGSLLLKEIHEHLMTFRFASALITTFLLVLVSLWMLGDDYVQRRDTFNKLSEDYEYKNEMIRVPSQAEPTVSYAPSPLSIFAQGEQRRFGNFITIKRWEVPAETQEGLTNNELMESLPPFDLLTVLSVIFSLFGVLYSYDSISREKERGTLKLMCSTSISRGAVYAAKFLGMVVVLFLPFIFSLLCGVLILVLFQGIAFTAAHWAAIALMVAAGFLYGTIFIGAGMLISGLMKKSSTSLVFCLSVWFLAVFLLPLLGTRLAEYLVPAGSTVEIERYKNRTEKECREKNWENALAVRPGSFSASVWSSTDIRRGGPANVMYDANPNAFLWLERIIQFAEPLWQQRADEVYNLVKQQKDIKSRQAQLASYLSYPSPTYQLKVVLTSLARTDYKTHSAFLEQARKYRVQFIANLRDKGYFTDNTTGFISRWTRKQVLENTPEAYQARAAVYNHRFKTEPGWFDMSTPKNWDAIAPLPTDLFPPFTGDFESPDFGGTVAPLVVLVLMTFITFWVGYTLFLRFDVR